MISNTFANDLLELFDQALGADAQAAANARPSTTNDPTT